ncbi:hypothetical protein [Curtobacterium sp. MCLR17_054]|uniref:hypothetical protein n=1 Tax=Curtobacterium sp. MCLR17_054 TaxID=2175632 RepID=UPI0011B559AA|nr:hypothetical protein [Curtobacterium sp. MCLR17_054]WIE70247.1 hypothetical protein DEJ08_018565 [Curtobacterium sp. MCLR17_054]
MKFFPLRAASMSLRPTARKWIALAAILPAMLGPLSTAVTASAVGMRPYASMGPGYGQPGVGAGELGAFRAESDGRLVWCIDAGALSPTGGVTGAPKVVPNLSDDHGHTLTADELAKLNAIISRHGPSANNDQAAAIALFVWGLADPTDYNGHGMSGNAWFITRAPASARPAIRNFLAAYRAEAKTIKAAPAAGKASLSIRMGSSYDGQVTVSASPATTKGTLTLSGAHVAGSSATTASVKNGSVVKITGTPTDAQASYRITANAHFTGTGGYAGNVRLYTTPGAQRLISAGTPGQPDFNASTFKTDPLSTVFSPVVTTKVASKFVKPGQAFVDGLTASVAKGSQKWRQASNGTYLAVKTTGALYGPFVAPPTTANTAPAKAPIVGTDTVTLDKGPGSYKSSGKLKAAKGGYYTWVWSIRAADHGRTQTQIPKSYAFTDRFGLVAETHVSPSAITATSHVADGEVPLSGALVDGIDVAAQGGAWLQDSAGKPVPVTFTGTAYHVPGDGAPAVSDTVTKGAVPLGTRKLTAPKLGSYTTAAEPIEAPAASGGYVSWVWQIRTADQPAKWQGYVQDWSDSFGLPNETARILVPEVSSVAKADIALGSPATDTGIIAGTMPAKPAQLTFEAYRQPQADDHFQQPRTTDDTTAAVPGDKPADGGSTADDDGTQPDAPFVPRACARRGTGCSPRRTRPLR